MFCKEVLDRWQQTPPPYIDLLELADCVDALCVTPISKGELFCVHVTVDIKPSGAKPTEDAIIYNVKDSKIFVNYIERS